VALVQDNEVYHYHLDHLGTPRELTNNKGDIVWKVRYKSWGNVALKECEEIENNIRFQGQYFDEETGLHYNRHRYYNPDTGQFISQDPIGLLGGVNNYQYAPNPLGWIDPLGLCKEGNPNSPVTFEGLKELVENDLDFSTTKDGAVFWSGKNMLTAQSWALGSNKTTLEQTKGGEYLVGLELFSKNSNLSGAQAAEVWDIASEKFSQRASGDLAAFSTGAKRENDYGSIRTWWRVEKPALENNTSVSSVTRMKIDGTPSKTGHIIK